MHRLLSMHGCAPARPRSLPAVTPLPKQAQCAGGAVCGLLGGACLGWRAAFPPMRASFDSPPSPPAPGCVPSRACAEQQQGAAVLGPHRAQDAAAAQHRQPLVRLWARPGPAAADRWRPCRRCSPTASPSGLGRLRAAAPAARPHLCGSHVRPLPGPRAHPPLQVCERGGVAQRALPALGARRRLRAVDRPGGRGGLGCARPAGRPALPACTHAAHRMPERLTGTAAHSWPGAASLPRAGVQSPGRPRSALCVCATCPPARRAGAAYAASAGGRLFKLEDVALGSWLEWAAARGGWAVHYVSDRR